MCIRSEALSMQICCCRQSRPYSHYLILIECVILTERPKRGTSISWLLVKAMNVQYSKPRRGVIGSGWESGKSKKGKRIVTDVHTNTDGSAGTEPTLQKPTDSVVSKKHSTKKRIACKSISGFSQWANVCTCSNDAMNYSILQFTQLKNDNKRNLTEENYDRDAWWYPAIPLPHHQPSSPEQCRGTRWDVQRRHVIQF